MPKSRKSSKRKNPGVGIDFKKAKHKVGKKLPRAQNDTETEIKSGKLFLAEQSVATDKSQLATTSRNNTLRELLSQVKHYSEKIRVKAINGLIELIREHPSEARPNVAEIVAATSSLASDPDQACRNGFVTFLRASLFPAIGEQSIQPFLAFLMAHTCSAMTHLSAAVRDSGIETINVLLEFRADLIGKDYFTEICQHYVEALGRSNRGRSLTAGSLKNLTSICEGCYTFLRATLPHVDVEAASKSMVRGVGRTNYEAGMKPQQHEEHGRPVVLSCQQCAWGPARSRSKGIDVNSGATAPKTDENNPRECPSDVALAGKLVALLLDCWEECGLVSQDDDMDAARGVRSNADAVKLAKHAKGAQNVRRDKNANKPLGERCGVAILRCCTLLIAKFKTDILSDSSITKLFTRIYPTYPNRTGCAVSAATAELLAPTVAELRDAHCQFDESVVDALASWSCECLACDFSTGMKVSLAIMSFAGPALRANMMQHALDAWRANDDFQDGRVDGKNGRPSNIFVSTTSLAASSTPAMTTINLGLKMLGRLVEPPVRLSRLTSVDEVLALWVGEIPSLLWKIKNSASSYAVQYTFKLGLSVLLHASQCIGSEKSQERLPELFTEIKRLSIKLVPLFGLKVKGKVRPGPLAKMPEELQWLAVEVLHNLPGLDNHVVGLVSLSLSPQPPPTSSSGSLSLKTVDRLMDLVYFKSHFGDPQAVWSFIFSTMELGYENQAGCMFLERASRLAIHCSPPGAAIRALVLPLLSKGTGPATYGALFFLRHCLTVFDDCDLGIEQPVIEATLQAIADIPAARASTDTTATTNSHDLGRDVVVRLVRQCPSAIPTVFTFLSARSTDINHTRNNATASTVLVDHIVEAVGDLELRPEVRKRLLDVQSEQQEVKDLLAILQ